ncbi:hypothetical protein F4818DRAFT_224819 [Hypoxylon cercidicola]|nr:hypothetical protein F4818DRAFT_224819 [Hypoxylon cercidicola]
MIDFFVNWELWQQMTFVLAAAIVVVFCAGLIKLWWLSRYLKKHTVLDLEKRARQTEMQKTGLPASKRIDIPFGVRAIQSGIQVDGIWISQPSTPVLVSQRSPSLSSTSTLEPDSRSKGKERELSVHLSTTVTEVQPTPELTPQPSPRISLSDRHIPTGVESSHIRAFPLGAQPTYRPVGPSRRRTDITVTETPGVDTRSRPEHNSARHPQVETYVPTNSFSSTESSASSTSQQRTVVDRSSSSSDEGTNHLRYVANLRRSAAPSPRALLSFDDPEPLEFDADYFSNDYAEQKRNPFETPSPPESQWVSRPPLAANRPPPRRSYSGESHANTSSRRVNAGFEILPAGTFGQSDSPTEIEDSRSRRHSSNKLQKKNRSSREGPPTR